MTPLEIARAQLERHQEMWTLVDWGDPDRLTALLDMISLDEAIVRELEAQQ